MTAPHNGERQVATTVSGIRRDHVARYEWAAERCAGLNVVDAGCGVGYGSKVLARGGARVKALDASEEALAVAREHFNHDGRIEYMRQDVAAIEGRADAVVAFEVLEHLPRPELALRAWRDIAGKLLLSVPNEDVFPYRPEFLHHFRHYTKGQLEEMLLANGWKAVTWWGQEGRESDPEPGALGRTLIVEAERTESDPEPLHETTAADFILPGARSLPKNVAIIAAGESNKDMLAGASTLGGISKWVDEVWAVNTMAGVIQHHRMFHMDDMRIQEARAEADPDSGVAGMMGWMADHPGPIYTSRRYPEYPGAVEYPLEWVCREAGDSYFNNTVPYAVAFAIAIGVEKIHLYGCDYGYDNRPELAWKREKGRACLEYWIARATLRGVHVSIAPGSSLLDMNARRPGREFYGYDSEWVKPAMTADGFRIARVPRRTEDVPTAKQMEVRYSHDPAIEQLEEAV